MVYKNLDVSALCENHMTLTWPMRHYSTRNNAYLIEHLASCGMTTGTAFSLLVTCSYCLQQYLATGTGTLMIAVPEPE